MNDLKTGQGNYANEYVHYMPAYMKSKAPILKNNSLVSASLASGVPEAPDEKHPYDTLTEQGLAERDEADEALMARLQETGSRLDKKLDESEYQADNNENVKKQIEENIKRGNAATKIKAVARGLKERQEYEKIKKTKNEAAEKIQKLARTKLSVTKADVVQTSEPKPVITSSSSKKSKDDDDDDDRDSIETNLEGDDPDKLQSFLEKIGSYGIEQQDLSKIIFKGGGVLRFKQYPMLQKIAKELYQKNNSQQFLDKTTDLVSNGKHKIKTVSELNNILEELKK